MKLKPKVKLPINERPPPKNFSNRRPLHEFQTLTDQRPRLTATRSSKVVESPLPPCRQLENMPGRHQKPYREQHTHRGPKQRHARAASWWSASSSHKTLAELCIDLCIVLKPTGTDQVTLGEQSEKKEVEIQGLRGEVQNYKSWRWKAKNGLARAQLPCKLMSIYLL
eukprot:Gb_32461 [translate_table: standard]